MLNHYYWLWNSILPKDFCEYIISSTNWDAYEDGTIFSKENNGPVVDKELRRTNVVWVDQMSVMGCVCNQYIQAANQSANWNYIIDSSEKVQLGKYELNGHYDWHKDTHVPGLDNRQRKLSISILLNDEFEGGELEFKDLTKEQQPTMKQGSIIVFPSFLEHRVNPITSGVRFSSVAWVSGPAFV
jgi:PKHD-type hydroxylase